MTKEGPSRKFVILPVICNYVSIRIQGNYTIPNTDIHRPRVCNLNLLLVTFDDFYMMEADQVKKICPIIHCI